jgi:diguanylate cyclase (GGDEF)-like protein
MDVAVQIEIFLKKSSRDSTAYRETVGVLMKNKLLERKQSLILVVDDDLACRLCIEAALQTEGYEVISVENGQQALDIAIKHLPDMIIMDVMMPVMDGYTACAAIRDQEDQLNVPILMLNGLDDVESVEKLFNAGATDFISKPVNLAIFKQRVRYGLKTRKSDLDLYRNQLRLAHAHKVAKIGYWEWDIARNHLFWSKEVYELLSVSAGDFRQNYEAFLERVHEDDLENVQNATEASLKQGIPFSIEHRVISTDEKIQVVHQHAELIKNESGEVVRMLGVVQDITERHLAQAQVEYQAYYDNLTGLPNRTLFYDRMNHALKASRRGKAEIAIFLIDLDRFKNINDSLGHDIGDGLLESVARGLSSVIREEDTLARLGGDEFALIIEDVVSNDAVITVANKLIDIMSSAQYINGNELISTGSIGVTISSAESRDKELLIKQADLAMYQAKESGGNRFCFYSAEMKSRAHQSLILEKELRQALERDELVVFYQPKISVRSGRIKGMEALVRWRHPEKGLVPPFDFIPIAEETGLIVPIGRWVLKEACKQTIAWQEQGFRDLTVSVNVSAKQFHYQGYVDEVRNALESSGISPWFVDLEVTESCTMNNVESAIRILESFRQMGIRISMDDFGTGYSSLSFLDQLPLDTLKVDRAFIKDINAQGKNGELARLIISMARSLRLSVVAEGVETKDHLEFLRTNGCDEYQGFLFSPPVPASEFEALLIENYQRLNNRGIDRQVSDIHPHFSTRTASSTLSILN